MRHRFLVTGGAGYIGSHMVRLLTDRGADVTVVDDLGQGHRAALPQGVELEVADVGDPVALDAIMAGRKWEAIVHFAGLSLVGESTQQPMRYLRQNAGKAFCLIDAALRHDVRRFVLSSTANIFGASAAQPILESAPACPSSPYGEAKLMIERALFWASECHDFRYACLRYFNAAGADPAGRIGEDHTPETHLIPSIIDAALGRRPELVVYGTDYPTEDGTCVRDYIHVTDLCEAHLLALKQLDHRNVTYNLGSGVGHSVKEVIKAVESVFGRAVPIRYGDRRLGDPAILVAGSGLIQAETGWKPKYSDLAQLVETASAWRRRNPHGYMDR